MANRDIRRKEALADAAPCASQAQAVDQPANASYRTWLRAVVAAAVALLLLLLPAQIAASADEGAPILPDICNFATGRSK